MVNRVGGGIFALRRPRPYSRAFAGISLRGIAAPTTIYVPRTSKGNDVEADNDAARRVATSFEKQENRFKPPYSRREMPPAAT